MSDVTYTKQEFTLTTQDGRPVARPTLPSGAVPQPTVNVQHDVNDPNYHNAALAADYGKFVRANETTGMVMYDTVQSDDVYHVVDDSEDTFTTKDWYDATQSAGRLYGGKITDDLDGSVTVAAGAGLSKELSSSPADGEECAEGTCGQVSEIRFVRWAETAVSLTDNAYNYIYYDGSAGVMTATTDFYSIDFSQDFTVGRVYRAGTTVTIRLCGTNLWNFNRRVQLFGEEVFPIKRARGLMLSETGTRNIAITEGILWAELVNRFVTEAFDSSGTDSFTYWYQTTGTWTAVTAQAQISNTQYNAIATGLANLSGNQHACHWVYVVHDSTVHVVYGTTAHPNLASAETEAAPELPGLLEAYATFVGRIIIKRAEDTFLEVASPFVDVLPIGVVANHNDLAGLQGGEAEAYYHFTLAEHTLLTGTKTANYVLAGPVSGAAAVPTFRALEVADMPDDLINGTLNNVPLFDTGGKSLKDGYSIETTLTGSSSALVRADAIKAAIDAMSAGLQPKESVVAATTGNITLSGAQTIDGHSVVAGDRVLVKSQTDSEDNGIYVAAAGAWSRATDADTWDEHLAAYVLVENGDTYENWGFYCNVASGGTLGTTAITWVVFSKPGDLSFSLNENYLVKATGANSLQDSAIYETGGSLGIGTTTPLVKLTVAGGNIGITNTGVSRLLMQRSGGTVILWNLEIGEDVNNNGFAISDLTNTKQKFVIESNENPAYFMNCSVGIGTASPSRTLHVDGTLRVEGITEQTGYVNVLVADADGNVDYVTKSTFQVAALTSAKIWVGNASNIATAVDITLSATGGTFALGSTGILTMPNAATGTRGLLTAADWTNFNTAYGWGDHDGLYALLNHGHGTLNVSGQFLAGFDVAIASGDHLVIGQNISGDSIKQTTLTFGSGTTTYLRNDGTWGTPAGGTSYTFRYSLTLTGSDVNLVGDVINPGNYKYYGTDFAGNRGWYDNTWQIGTGGIYYTGAASFENVGIGTSTPAQLLHVEGNIRMASTGLIYRGADRYIHSTGTTSLYVGTDAGNLTATATGNTGVGDYALLSATSGNYNTAVGLSALRNTTTAMYNTAVGQSALYENTLGWYNVAIGSAAMYSAKRLEGCVAIGFQAMYYANNQTATTISPANTAVGAYALRGSTTAANNTGTRNTAIGFDALTLLTTGSYNTAIGANAGKYVSTGGAGNNETSQYSVYIGSEARGYADGGTNEIAIGYNAIGNGSNTATIGNSSILATYLGGVIMPTHYTSSPDNRPTASSYQGGIIYNSTTGKHQYSDGTNWVDL